MNTLESAIPCGLGSGVFGKESLTDHETQAYLDYCEHEWEPKAFGALPTELPYHAYQAPVSPKQAKHQRKTLDPHAQSPSTKTQNTDVSRSLNLSPKP